MANGVLGFVMLFFGVWWAWMNYTWFASAHDSDDVAHRLLTFVQMTGALVFATGVTRAVEEGWLVVGVVGYVIMRVGLVLSWLRVARDRSDRRRVAWRYVSLVGAVQVLWIGVLALPSGAQRPAFVVLALCELAVPMIAERGRQDVVFHPGHIDERYGLFTIIVLGEAVLAAAVGFQEAVDDGGLTAGLLAVGLGGLVIAFAAWWLYFDHPGHLTPTPDRAFQWGYVHAVVFVSLAALGAGIHVAAQAMASPSDGEHGEHISGRVAAMAVAVPVAGFLVGLVGVMAVNRTALGNRRLWPKVVGAGVVLAVGFVATVPATVVAAALVMTALAVAMVAVEPV